MFVKFVIVGNNMSACNCVFFILFFFACFKIKFYVYVIKVNIICYIFISEAP